MLTGAEKHKLRGQAQLLEPLLIVGKKGLTPEILEEITAGLKRRRLIKIRFKTDDRLQQERWCLEIAEKTQSEYICSVGRTGTFYRVQADPEEGEITPPID